MLLALAFTIDISTGAGTVIAALIAACASLWNTYRLRHVYKLVNSNYSESVNAKIAAEGAKTAAEIALKVQQEVNRQQQAQLDTLKLFTPVPPVPPPRHDE